MSDPATTFRKFKDAKDPAGDLGWSSKMARKGLKAGAAAPPDLEDAFGLSDDERVLWRLLKIPRMYMDLENTGVVPAEVARGFFRALMSADVLEVVDASEAKPIVPVEVVRLKKAVAGQEVKTATSPLKARVYRPDISGAPDAAASEAPPPPGPTPAPKPEPPKAAAPKPEPPKPAAPKPAAPKPETRTTPTGDDKQLLEDIERRYKEMSSQNHYQFLDIQPSAQADGVKKAYMKLAKELHPDRIASVLHDAEAAKKADSLFKRLQDAWSTLNNPESRSSYDRKLGNDPTAGASGGGGKVRRTDEAKLATMKADHFVKTKHLKDAEAQYKAALLLDDSYLPAHLGLAWAVFLNEGRNKTERTADAKRRLAELADKNRLADAHYKLSLIARVEGNDEEHDRRVKLAAKLDPRHKDAMQELRLMQRRNNGKAQGTGSADKGGGFFSKLKR